MAKVTTFSRHFPKTHPKSGSPTYFVEQILNQRKVDYTGKEYLQQLFLLNQKNLLERKITLQDLANFQNSLSPDCDGNKHHTIRNGFRYKQGEYFSPRVWSKNPYNSPQIIFLPLTVVKRAIDINMSHIYINYNYKLTSVFMNGRNSMIENTGLINLNKINCLNSQDWLGNLTFLESEIYKNDGLSLDDFIDWFISNRKCKEESKRICFSGQIICWSDTINY